ncbi:CoA ester lyase [Rhodosalinus halophilus]|uniref:CoA ester lyase n=1 Tax=Rhodosalinus halophilus TaxID=2259333 RepID=A0A365U7A2_9RHOB|nr:CoA ester lyase [Rhodosalinus halophilus]RBI84096.1 CoA ester lyase [Rhodosalinus halophilus]
MDERSRPYRSVLYIPGSKERALEKARGLPVDAIIFDLEDAVAPDTKQEARETLRKELDAGGYGKKARLVRVNGLDTEWGAADITAMQGADFDGLLLPKVSGPGDLDRAAELMGDDTPLWAMMETPRGILNAPAIAAHPRLAGFVAGTNDLAKELGCAMRADRLPMLYALEAMLMAARAEGKVSVDGVFNHFRDEDGLRAECEQGRDLGFDGKTLIHPAQVATANAIFAPAAEDIELARRQIEAFDEAQARGEGVAVVDGRIVENLHVETARRTLAKAEAIAALAH